jgi:hypothetical protein
MRSGFGFAQGETKFERKIVVVEVKSLRPMLSPSTPIVNRVTSILQSLATPIGWLRLSSASLP